MTGAGSPGGLIAPPPTLVTYTHWMYALHAFSALMGVFSTTTVVGQFVFGVPAIIAVIMNYLKRSEVRGTWLDSHFGWQLRTFWYAALWIGAITVFSAGLTLVLIGFLTWPVGIAIVGVWILYRVVRGWHDQPFLKVLSPGTGPPV